MNDILYLPIKSHYFNLIALEQKRTEWRKYTPHYHSRIHNQLQYLHLRAGYSLSCPELLIEIMEITHQYSHLLRRDAYAIHLGNLICVDWKGHIPMSSLFDGLHHSYAND